MSLPASTLAEIAAVCGTPVYVYDGDLLRARCRALSAACGDYPHAMHYAIKANATLAVVRLMREEGAAADANSGGEIEVALRAGYAPDQIVFTGVGKSRAELARAVVEAGWNLNELHSIGLSLEEIFLELTGAPNKDITAPHASTLASPEEHQAAQASGENQ